MPNEDENKILLSDVLERCLDFREDPSEEKYAEIEKSVDSLNPRERLSLAEKGLIVLAVLNKVEDSMNPLDCAFDLTSAFFFKGTLSYFTNLKIDIPENLMSIEMYDVLVTFGLEDKVLEFSGKDHARLRKMLDDSVNFSNVFRLVNATKLISGENISELQNVLTGIKEALTLDKIRELKSVLAEADPVWTKLKESVGEEAVFAATAKEVNALDASMKESEEKKEEGEADESAA